jgi:hypothetical protein
VEENVSTKGEKDGPQRKKKSAQKKNKIDKKGKAIIKIKQQKKKISEVSVIGSMKKKALVNEGAHFVLERDVEYTCVVQGMPIMNPNMHTPITKAKRTTKLSASRGHRSVNAVRIVSTCTI